MIRTARTLAVGVAATALVLGVSASPASAKTRAFSDQRGDARSELDITKVKVSNTKHAVVVRMTVPKLRKSKVGFAMVVLRTKAKGRPEYSSMKTRVEGAGWMPLMLMDERSEELTVACRGDRIRFNKKSVTVRIPQRCLGDNRKAVRVAVALGGRDWMEIEEDITAGDDTPVDAYPHLTKPRMSPWVRYR